MKFINLGNKHAEYDFFENTPPENNEGKPRRIPSYIDTAKKNSSKRNAKTK